MIRGLKRKVVFDPDYFQLGKPVLISKTNEIKSYWGLITGVDDSEMSVMIFRNYSEPEEMIIDISDYEFGNVKIHRCVVEEIKSGAVVL
jgi:hypothetical protein